MKRVVVIGLLFSVCLLAGCGKTDKKENKETVKEVATQEVSDYTKLSEKELEVLGYDNDVEAMMELANRYDYGTEDSKQDFEEAKKWYEMAAEAGNADATCVLGYYALNGITQDVDVVQAATYFQKAMDAGNERAYVGMARTYLAGYGDETEHAMKAYEYTNMAYEKNIISGVYYMAYLLENGIGCEQDYVRAIALYEQVMEAEDLSIYDAYLKDAAATNRGMMHIHGEGMEQNYEEAMDCFEKAADDDYAMAEYYLGQMYENGFGCDQDYDKAFDWYQKAANQDYAPALNQMGYLYYNGYGVDTDIDQAIYYQKLAAMQGYAAAQINLGYLFENGIGVEQNYSTALAYYRMAAEQNNEGAKEAVVRVLKLMDEEQ